MLCVYLSIYIYISLSLSLFPPGSVPRGCRRGLVIYVMLYLQLFSCSCYQVLVYSYVCLFSQYDIHTKHPIGKARGGNTTNTCHI